MTKRDAYLRRTYGISQKTYKTMLAEQGGVCFICEQKPKPGKNLHVDHDHKTEAVRGLLCWRCNKNILGRNRENPDIHTRAAAYLCRTRDWRTYHYDPLT